MIALALLLLWAGSAAATTFRVPFDYVTIQSALNETAAGDTVLVALGMYAEALWGPPHAFVLKGDVEPDTGLYPRPVIDPTSLPNPWTLTCLRINAAGSTIEDMTFRNGPQMYREEEIPGGLDNTLYATTLRRCVFDSTYFGVMSRLTTVTLEDCRFRRNSRRCVDAHNGTIMATDCDFEGQNVQWAMVWCGSDSRFLRCHFSHIGSVAGHLAMLVGNNLEVSDCVIGPAGESGWTSFFTSLENSLLARNIFHHCTTSSGLVAIGSRCEAPVSFVDNEFRDNHLPLWWPEGGTICLSIGVEDTSNGFCDGALIENNRFYDCERFTAISFSNGPIKIRHNRFTRMGRPYFNSGVLYANIPETPGPREVYDNLFYDNVGWAAFAFNETAMLDASWNWWGDSTGPYNSGNNPGGLGDSVSNWVTFDPWHTDTSFFWNEAAEPPLPLPREVSMNVFPQPFNANATLQLIVSQPRILRVELFDVLGRRVREVWSGAVGSRKDITINGNDLSSGIYFARTFDIISNRSVNMAKLVVLK